MAHPNKKSWVSSQGWYGGSTMSSRSSLLVFSCPPVFCITFVFMIAKWLLNRQASCPQSRQQKDEKGTRQLNLLQLMPGITATALLSGRHKSSNEHSRGRKDEMKYLHPPLLEDLFRKGYEGNLSMEIKYLGFL